MARSWFPMFRSTWTSYINELGYGQRWIAATLFMMAATRPRQGRWGREKITVRPGQILTTIRDIAAKANASRGVVESALRELERFETISIRRKRAGLLITLLSYDEFRLDSHAPGLPGDTDEATNETGNEPPERHPKDIPSDTDTEWGEQSPTPPNKEVRSEEGKKLESESIARARAELPVLGDAARRLGPKPAPGWSLDTSELDDRLTRQSQALWNTQEVERSALRAEEGIGKDCRGSIPMPTAEHLAPVRDRLITYGYEECERVLRLYVTEARAQRNLRWLDGAINWSADNFRRQSLKTEAQIWSDARGDRSEGETPARTLKRLA